MTDLASGVDESTILSVLKGIDNTSKNVLSNQQAHIISILDTNTMHIFLKEKIL